MALKKRTLRKLNFMDFKECMREAGGKEGESLSSASRPASTTTPPPPEGTYGKRGCFLPCPGSIMFQPLPGGLYFIREGKAGI